MESVKDEETLGRKGLDYQPRQGCLRTSTIELEKVRLNNPSN